ncbi:hypothetical protein BV22DRAFT_1106623 [Leucogyrophana mollusca]|uniref:Uncharacterized protein n=1 Tax=Leucogyrophana mollusca TaxID=85980 RepID=A0ACB8BA52_9AGAM|nr:hypothetical protein BV22DRAFT_1106623 [Leucogyrophana mollusca]
MHKPSQHPMISRRHPKPTLYTIYESAADIHYTPEAALEEGLKMVKTLKGSVKKIELGSKLRKDVWLREIESLQSQGAPSTMIAVCGATGAGKSSILNAILDDNIVPTSGMRACTAVVTEIAHHTKPTIDADVSFLSEAEWRQELTVLLDDMVDEDGNLKRSTDLRSDSGVAWHKVHAVYPSISQEQLVRMSVDQIIARDKSIAAILGTTKNIVAKDSKTFSHEIGKYIDSKDQKRSDKKKDKKKDKDGSKKKKDDGPALWPLIRQVNVRCASAALSTGAILVDLPGVADANAARNSIAKDYMKKCDCVWILAPITRAVDDKTARDLLGDAFKMQLMSTYDAHAITFIASKCDDISCSEVIRALGLDDLPQLEEIEERIEQYGREAKESKAKKAEAERNAKAIDAQLKHIRACIREHEEHVKALESGETFVPRLTGKAAQKKAQSMSKKRKNTRGGKGGSPKRRKSHGGSDDDDLEMGGSDDEDTDAEGSAYDDDDMDAEGSDEDEADQDSDSDKVSDDSDAESGSESDSDSDAGSEEAEEEEEVTVEILQTKIDAAKQEIKAARERLTEARKARKDAMDILAGLKKKELKAQKDKNAFCSLKRSDFSREVLKSDFRIGLKDLDDAAAEERDPEAFDPNVNLRNYDEIDLPVFTCSSRDYVRLKGQVKGDGEATCFSNVEDTGIPALQQWCHQLTVSSRERAARNFLSRLKAFSTSVRVYVEGIGDVTAVDREELREKWESTLQHDDGEQPYRRGWLDSDGYDSDGYDSDGYDGPDFESWINARLLTMHNKPPVKVDPQGEPVGVTPRLIKEFGVHIDASVGELQNLFRDGLEEKCQAGAANAAEGAVQLVDDFAASMHWGTYRATLRRHGSWRRDMNVELLAPFTRNIASSWSKIFEGDLFASLSAKVMGSINRLLKDVEDSAAAGLKDRTKHQGEVSLDEARVALKKTVEVIRETLNTEQKEVSRCLAPHVQDELGEGYNRAMEERGRGSVARQKTVFHNYVDRNKHDIFDGGAEVLMGRLSSAAENIGKALEGSLQALAEKIEVSLAVLWEGTRDDPNQVRVRQETVNSVSEMQQQMQLWTQAEQMRMVTN